MCWPRSTSSPEARGPRSASPAPCVDRNDLRTQTAADLPPTSLRGYSFASCGRPAAPPSTPTGTPTNKLRPAPHAPAGQWTRFTNDAEDKRQILTHNIHTWLAVLAEIRQADQAEDWLKTERLRALDAHAELQPRGQFEADRL